MLPTTTRPVFRPWRTWNAMPCAAGARPDSRPVPPDAERRVHRALRVVLVGDGRAEQRHDPVAEELVDGALVAVHLGEHQLEGAGHQAVDVLGIEALEASEVKPETSTKSTVTCLRSPSSALLEVRIFSARCLGV